MPPDKQANWKVNRAYVLKQVGRTIIACFKGSQDGLQCCIDALIHVLANALERVPSNRSF